MHGDGRGVLAEALVSWLSLYGVASAFQVYWNQTTRSRLERCIMFLLEYLALRQHQSAVACKAKTREIISCRAENPVAAIGAGERRAFRFEAAA